MESVRFLLVSRMLASHARASHLGSHLGSCWFHVGTPYFPKVGDVVDIAGWRKLFLICGVSLKSLGGFKKVGCTRTRPERDQNETRLEEFRIRNKIEAIIVHRKPAENNRGPLYTR